VQVACWLHRARYREQVQHIIGMILPEGDSAEEGTPPESSPAYSSPPASPLPADDKVGALFHAIDADGSGALDLAEFKVWAHTTALLLD
jgi:hypothetical protein